MAGSFYIWIMGGLCLAVTLLIAGMALIFWIGHRLEKKETGATHGFLELPEELRSSPAKSDPPEPPAPPT